MPAYEQTIIVIAAATIDREPSRHNQILQVMQNLADFLRRQIRCPYVSPVLQNWPRWQWQLIGEVRHDVPFDTAMQGFFSLDEFKALKAVAATDCSFYRPVQQHAASSDDTSLLAAEDLVPPCFRDRSSGATDIPQSLDHLGRRAAPGSAMP